jgi:DNA-binding transcriptional MerR regulator/trans-aconitate methyltransferase
VNSKLYTAGEIAKLVGVSVRTIRFYDNKGILKPADYSEAGYRYYDLNSLEKLQKILMLKFVGFSLEQIEELMQNQEKQADYGNLKDSLAMQKQLLKEKKDHLEKLIEAVEVAEQAEEEQIWDELIHIIQVTNQNEKIEKQYKSADNLQKRINIHSYSTAKTSWMPWVFERLQLRSGMKILEIGCGNGLLWQQVMKQLPDQLDIYMTDNSEGMLSKAREMTEQYKEQNEKKEIHFRFDLKDANNFEIENETFDLIIANHMLYHVSERQNLFHKVKELLNPEGIFCCTTVGDTHMTELHQLVEKFDQGIEVPFDWISKGFRLENGKGQLNQVFSQVSVEKHENDLIVDDVDAIYDYVYSYPGNAATVLQEHGEKFRSLIMKKIEQEGAMYIHKSTGIFLCKR